MGMMSRYLERLVARVRRQPVEALACAAGPAGLQVGDERVAWHEVRRLDAYKRDGYVGDHLCLAVSCTDGRVIETDEGMPGWQETGRSIERFLPYAVPHGVWMLRLVAAGPGDRVAVYPAP